MSVLDMPIEELKKYRGTNPSPADFDAYWEKALKEMHSVEPDVELIPADFQVWYADCYDMYFTGVRNARIYAKFIIPKKRKEKMPAILMFHGYTANSGNWNELLSYAAAGFVVAAMDCRGQGGRSEDTGGVKGTTVNGHVIRGLDGEPQDLLMRHIFLDTAKLAGIMMDMPEVDEKRVGVAGGSQGGALSVACAALEPRIAKAAIQYPFLSDYKRVWEMDLTKSAYAELWSYFRHFDPLHQREKQIFEKLGYLDVQNLAPKIRGEVLQAVSLLDDLCPPSTQFAVYNKIKSSKEALIYYDYGHEYLPGYSDRAFQFMMGFLTEEEKMV